MFEFIQKSDDKERLRDIIPSQEKYHHIDVTTVDLINTYTATHISTETSEGGKVEFPPQTTVPLSKKNELTRHRHSPEIPQPAQKSRLFSCAIHSRKTWPNLLIIIHTKFRA